MAGGGGGTVGDAGASLVHVAFKHANATHFIMATASSFHVFTCEPLLDIRVSSDEGSEVTCAEMRTQSELVVVTRKPNAVDGSIHDHAVHFWNELHGKRMDIKTIKSPAGTPRGAFEPGYP